MRSSKLALAFLGWLTLASSALAQLITPASMRDANLTTTSTQNLVTTLNTFSAQRTLTIPGSGALSAYYFQFVDTASAINGANTLRIVAADGALINGGASLVVATQGAYVFIISSPSGYAATIVPPTASGGGGTPGGSSGQVQYNNAGTFGGFTTSGDLTINTATGAGTFATVNANVGAFGSNVNCTTYTVNAKGLITAASQTACTPPITAVTGLGTGVQTALQVAVGSAGAPVLFNGAGGTPSSLVGTNITGTAAGLTAGTASAVAVGGITGLGAGCATWLATPSSANLRSCISDESGTGLAYFQGGDLGTPSAGVGTNLTGIGASYTAGNATKLTTPRAIGIAGSTGLTATGVNFDGSAAINLALTGTLLKANGGTGITTGAVVSITAQRFTTSGTYTPTTGMIYAVIEGVGPGGAGGGSTGAITDIKSGGGGGSGGCSRIVVSAATIGASKAVVIGTGGVGASNAAGGAGSGATTVGATILVANAGSGGALNNGSTAFGAGGGGGAAGTGDLFFSGAAGAFGILYFTPANAPTLALGGAGASSCYGGGASAPAASTGQTAAGLGGVVPGSGGSGGISYALATNTAGGNGANGFVLITEYCSQ